MQFNCQIIRGAAGSTGRKTERWGQPTREGHCKTGALRNVTWHIDLPQFYFVKKIGKRKGNGKEQAKFLLSLSGRLITDDEKDLRQVYLAQATK